MNNRDRIVIKKIKAHADAIIQYCKSCKSLEEFERTNGKNVQC